jgi:hypothetical protein
VTVTLTEADDVSLLGLGSVTRGVIGEIVLETERLCGPGSEQETVKFSLTVWGVPTRSRTTGIEPAAGTRLQSAGAVAVNASEPSTLNSGPRFVTAEVKVTIVGVLTGMLNAAGAVFTTCRSVGPWARRRSLEQTMAIDSRTPRRSPPRAPLYMVKPID